MARIAWRWSTRMTMTLLRSVRGVGRLLSPGRRDSRERTDEEDACNSLCMTPTPFELLEWSVACGHVRPRLRFLCCPPSSRAGARSRSLSLSVDAAVPSLSAPDESSSVPQVAMRCLPSRSLGRRRREKEGRAANSSTDAPRQWRCFVVACGRLEVLTRLSRCPTGSLALRPLAGGPHGFST